MMISHSDLIHLHYEFAMAIGNSLDLHKMLRSSLSTFLRKMNCPAGGVHFYRRTVNNSVRFEEVLTIPTNAASLRPYEAALDHLSDLMSTQSLNNVHNILPISGMVDKMHYHVVALPDLGVMVFCKSTQLDAFILRSLEPVLNKLAVSCKACLQNAELHRHQDNLQEMVEEQTGELVAKNRQLSQEIVQRKHSEQALRKSEEKYRELVQNANSIILRWDTKGRVTFFNEYAQSFFGFSEQDILGKHVIGTIVPETESTGRDLDPLMEDICTNPQKYEYNVNENMRKDGSRVWIAWTNKVLIDDQGQRIGALSIGADITMHRESEQRFRLAAEAISDLIYEWDIADDSLRWFGDIDVALGYETGALEHTLAAWMQSIHPEDQTKLAGAVTHHRTATDPINYEYRVRHKDGSYVYWSDYAVPVLDSGGKPRKWIGACTDITEKKKAEQQLIESEKRYRALFTNEIDAISIFEVQTGRIINVNDSWIKLYGYQREELGKLTVADVSAEPVSTRQAVKESADIGTVFIPERKHRKKDGSIFTVELSAGPFTWKGQQLMYALVRDITERKKAEDNLKHSEQLLAETQELAQLGSWEFDVLTEKIKWSEETFRIAGIEQTDSLTLQQYLESVHPDDLPLLDAAMQKSTEEHQPYALELRHRRPDGSYNYTFTRGKPVVHDGRIVKFIGSVLDITERKLAEQELQRAKDYLENVLENSPDGICIVDKSGMFSKWNFALAELYGFSYAELEGKSYREFYPDADNLEKMLRLLRQNGYVRKYEIEMLKKDGTIRPFELSISLLKDEEGKNIGSVCLTRDLSEAKKTLNELTTAYDELHLAKETAEAANRAKSSFLANMSHELRTPLNAIIGFSELMTRDPHLSGEQLANLETIGRSGEHLLSLINDVLEFSTIEAGRIELHQDTFDLHHLLVGINEMFRLRARQKQLFLYLEQASDLPQYILADQSKLRQILINLLGNAVKFTDTGGITLRVSCRETTQVSAPPSCLLHVEVVDTGRGIEQKEQNKVFDAFFQSGEILPTHQGTGLGLPISQRFVEIMGGVLTLDSEPGKGSSFSFSIPIEISRQPAQRTSYSTSRVIRIHEDQVEHRLLVAEDNDNNRSLLVKLLEGVGFKVAEARNGQEAIAIWKNWHPSLIWMDMRMPVLDGYAATREIKASPGGKDTIIIALTASAFEEDRQRVIANGGNDFVRKPFREQEIFEMLEKHLDVRFHRETKKPAVLKQNDSLTTEEAGLALVNISDDLRHSLSNALEKIDFDAVMKLIEEIKNTNHPLACFLADRINAYQFDALQDLINKENT